MNPTYDFRGQVALVTGAGAGMGLDTARAFAAAGATVVLSDVNEEAMRTATDELADGDRRAATSSTAPALASRPVAPSWRPWARCSANSATPRRATGTTISSRSRATASGGTVPSLRASSTPTARFSRHGRFLRPPASKGPVCLCTHFRESARLYTYLPHGGDHDRHKLRDALTAYRNVIEAGFASQARDGCALAGPRTTRWSTSPGRRP
jgi:hypothetical protein